uniref:Integrase catalytic domain-containing protein n=1 Tax=Caenorhabditis japonica TaxID=281687 RepID=A0A8R1I3M3_CAEJA
MSDLCLTCQEEYKSILIRSANQTHSRDGYRDTSLSLKNGSELSEREKTRLLLGSLEETTFHRFVDSQRDVEDVYGVTFKETVAALTKIFGAQRSLMVQRQACFHISRSSGNWEDPLEYTNHIANKDSCHVKQNPQTPVEVWKLEASKTKRRENPRFTPKWGSKDRRPPFCDYCKRAGHHISKCFLKRKDEGTETQSIKVDVVNAELSAKRSVRVNVNGKPLQFDLDTGSMITIINSESWNMIGRPPLERVEHRISCANGSEMRALGRARVTFALKGSEHKGYVYVREKNTNLIGMSWLSQSPLMRKAMDVMVNQIEIPSAGMARLKDNPTVRSGNCQQNTKRTRITPSKPCPDTKKPWAQIYVDFAGPIDGFWFLVVEDSKTKYAEVKLTRKASAAVYQHKGYVYVREKNTNLIGMSWLSQSPLMRKAMDVMVNQIEIPSAGMARLKDNPTVRSGNCQQNTKRTRITPLKPCPDTKKPWAQIYVDFAGPIDGFWFLVVEDSKTKYAEVKLTRKASAAATVDLIEDIFATHGYPDWIVSDNGTQLSSHLFKKMYFSSFSCNHPELDVVNSGCSPRGVRQGVFGSSPAAHDTSKSDGFGRVNRGNQKMECRSELNEHQSPNSRTFLERKEEVSSPCKQQLESEVQQDVSRVQPAPNLSQSLRRSQRNRRAPVRYDPCLELQSHSEDRAPKRGSAPYSDRAAARSRGLHIASNCRLAPSQGRTKDNFVKGEGVGKARGRPRWY